MNDREREILRRAKALSDQVERLHEISFTMGQYSHICDPDSVPELHRAAQVIMETAAKLSFDLSELLSDETPTETAVKVIRLKDHLPKLTRKSAP